MLDTHYKYAGFTHKRVVARAFVLNEEGKIAIHRIFRDDMFGKEGYFETPGGGVDEGETPREAVVRECREELGVEIEPLEEVGVVDDAYNLIHRENENHYFLAKVVGKAEKHFVSDGDALIQETVWVPFEEALALYESMAETCVSGLVKQRELPMLQEAILIYDKKYL
ncbi:MAG: NUDIX hydrolase [Bacilli bacterium]|nr:NUDIX hydrolase [Bacilli bacterium]